MELSVGVRKGRTNVGMVVTDGYSYSVTMPVSDNAGNIKHFEIGRPKNGKLTRCYRFIDREWIPVEGGAGIQSTCFQSSLVLTTI